MDEKNAEQLKKNIEAAREIVKRLTDQGIVPMGVVVSPEQQLIPSLDELLTHKRKELN
jgi:hypothetical protein